MQRYSNLSGRSGIRAYEIGEDSLTVLFADGAVYLYTAGSAGHDRLERMKQLARAGRGLNSFISRDVRKAYARRLR